MRTVRINSKALILFYGVSMLLLLAECDAKKNSFNNVHLLDNIDSVLIMYNVRKAVSLMNYHERDSVALDSGTIYYPPALSSCVIAKDSLLFESLRSVLDTNKTEKPIVISGLPDYRIVLFYTSHSYDLIEVFNEQDIILVNKKNWVTSSTMTSLVETVIAKHDPFWERSVNNKNYILQ